MCHAKQYKWHHAAADAHVGTHNQTDRKTHSHIRLDRLFGLKCPASPESVQLGVAEHVCLFVHILSAVCTLYVFREL